MVAVQGLSGMGPLSDGMVDVQLRVMDTCLEKPIDACTQREIGLYGEDLAASYLEARGYELLHRNWRCVFGEADIVAADGDELVLVEVKTRTCGLYDNPELAPEIAVDSRKRSRYEKLALMCYAEQSELASVRFDVIAIKLVGEQDVLLRHLFAAYSWDR
ncbi:MAG: YraN family protein [Coriobacteriales bacterium]|nr:YraN family protein [Coriobacteriales bacterium]